MPPLKSREGGFNNIDGCDDDDDSDDSIDSDEDDVDYETYDFDAEDDSEGETIYNRLRDLIALVR